MEGAVVPLPEPTAKGGEAVEPSDDAKGLKTNAVGMLSSVVIGIASTAPAYSLAVTLGLVVVVAGVGLKSPAIMLVSFIPMILIASSYYYLNKADPDCGTTFSWVTRAIGPRTGWVTGWVMVAADIIVMASLAQITGTYFFLLIGANGLANSLFWVTFVGVAFLVIMCVITAIGIEVSARLQWFLLGFEYLMLVIFSVVALTKVYAAHPTGSIHPAASWFVPNMNLGALAGGVLLALFIYWGWDTAVSVNEETERKSIVPGIAAILSTVALVFIYVLATTAAQAFHGPAFLGNNSTDVLSPLGNAVLGSGLDKLLIAVVLTSATASTLTTILPGARTTLSMASHRAIPSVWSKVNPRFQTPVWGTVDLRRALDRLVRGSDPAQPERAGRLDRRPGHHDRLLLRHQRLRRAALLPSSPVRELEDRADAARVPADRRRHPDLGADRVVRQPLVPGQLGLGHLVVRRRAALRPGRRLPGRSASWACCLLGLLQALEAVLRAQDGDGRCHGAVRGHEIRCRRSPVRPRGGIDRQGGLRPAGKAA